MVTNERIVLRWDANDDSGPTYRTTVTITFAALDDGRTLVTIAEEGWHRTETGERAAFDNCEGWSGVLCCMKAWLEHGIGLRDGFYA